jgi:hypothetical protein
MPIQPSEFRFTTMAAPNMVKTMAMLPTIGHRDGAGMK